MVCYGFSICVPVVNVGWWSWMCFLLLMENWGFNFEACEIIHPHAEIWVRLVWQDRESKFSLSMRTHRLLPIRSRVLKLHECLLTGTNLGAPRKEPAAIDHDNSAVSISRVSLAQANTSDDRISNHSFGEMEEPHSSSKRKSRKNKFETRFWSGRKNKFETRFWSAVRMWDLITKTQTSTRTLLSALIF